jgi:50S ribosomal subunit-associated GTPase HflX
VSAKTAKGLHKLQEAVLHFVRGQQLEVVLECDVTNGKLLSFIEKHSRVQERDFVDEGDRVRIVTVVGKQTLADLQGNDQLEIKSAKHLE